MTDQSNDNMTKALSRVPAKLLTNWSYELTSRCNLRCTYCSVPHSKTYGEIDMPKERIDKLNDLMKTVNPTIFSLSGRGELTYIEGWEELIEPLVRMGIPTHTVTNLAKPLTWEQAEKLAQISSLTISIDHVDRDIMKVVRKGVDLRNILYNVELIKAAAIANGRPQMSFSVIAVVTKATAGRFKELASMIAAIGAKSLMLQDLVMDYSDIVDTVDIGHISEFSQEELVELGKDLIAAKNILEARKIGFSMHPSIVSIVNAAFGQQVEEVIVSEMSDSPKVGVHRRHGAKLEDGETRDCLHPWHLGIFLADGGVEPCCGSYGVTANYDMAKNVDEIFNSPDWVELRKELLSGKLKKECEFCGSAGKIKIPDFQKKVQKYIRDNIQKN